MRLSEDEKKELLQLAGSTLLREDMRLLAHARGARPERRGRMTPDEYLSFVTQFSEFINHRRKPFRRIKEGKMRL